MLNITTKTTPLLTRLMKLSKSSLKASFSANTSMPLDFVSLGDKSRSGILQMKGKDVLSTLHNLTAANVEQFYEDDSVGQLHTCFLNSKGKIISDCFIVKPLTFSESSNGIGHLKEGEIWVEYSKANERELALHLKKHSFRKDV